MKHKVIVEIDGQRHKLSKITKKGVNPCEKCSIEVYCGKVIGSPCLQANEHFVLEKETKPTTIKDGDICTLTHNHSIVFRYRGVNKFGFPYSDLVMYMGEFTSNREKSIVAYTKLFEKADSTQRDLFNKKLKEENP